MDPFSYQWIFIVGIIFAFFDAFGIGANDVANSFATSVGSRSLTLAGAVSIAIFTEFGGAILLGASTTETVKNGIIDIKSFSAKPEVLMMGFMCALIGSSIFVNAASVVGWPVSTTHSIVGALAGVGLATNGTSSIQWKPVSDILISWVAAPGIAAVLASGIFLITRMLVLKHDNSLQRGIFAIPFYFVITLGITTFYVLSKAPKLGWDLSKDKSKTAVNLGTTFGLAAMYGILCLVPYFKRVLIEEEDLKWYHAFMPWTPKQPKNNNLHKFLDEFSGKTDIVELEKDLTETSDAFEPKEMVAKDSLMDEAKKMGTKALKALTYGIRTDVATLQGEGKHIHDVHENAIRYENKTEYLFSFLQVCTAAFASFAHGSNDVANAAGPLAGIVAIYETGELPSSKVGVPVWVLAVMGLAIDLGLVILGYRIMRVLGNNVTYHTPSRGFSMELGAALTVVTASFLAIPVSTTHCITGATIGVGLCNGTMKAVNWRIISWILFGWVLTVPTAGLISGGLFKMLLSAPHF